MWITKKEIPPRPVNTRRNGKRKDVDKLDVGIYIKSQFQGNPRGKGRAAAIIEYVAKDGKCHIRQKQIQVEYNTRNALNLKISIAAMRLLVKPCHITIYTDCEYMGNTYGWLKKWQQDGWKKANGQPPANVDDWRQFYMLSQIHYIDFQPYSKRYDKQLKKIIKEKIDAENDCHI